MFFMAVLRIRIRIGSGFNGVLEDLVTVDRSLPPVEWGGSRELAEAPPEVTCVFIVIFLDPVPDQWDGSRELAEAPPEVT
jgi:hypothetical protein